MLRKPCSKCGTTDIPKQLFYRPDGALRAVSSRCRLCYTEDERERMRNNKEQRYIAYRKWASTHREDLNRHQRTYRAKHSERLNEERRRKDALNREKLNAYARNWRRKRRILRSAQENYELRNKSRWAEKNMWHGGLVKKGENYVSQRRIEQVG